MEELEQTTSNAKRSELQDHNEAQSEMNKRASSIRHLLVRSNS